MSIETIILNQVKELVNSNLRSESSYKKLNYTRGFFDAMRDIKRLIDFGESLNNEKNNK